LSHNFNLPLKRNCDACSANLVHLGAVFFGEKPLPGTKESFQFLDLFFCFAHSLYQRAIKEILSTALLSPL